MSLRSHSSASLPGERVAAAVVGAPAAAEAAAEGGPAVTGCGHVEVDYGCDYCYGC